MINFPVLIIYVMNYMIVLSQCIIKYKYVFTFYLKSIVAKFIVLYVNYEYLMPTVIQGT